jgi:hypothetical protein
MPSIQEGLSEDKAARMMTALRERQTLRQFAMAKNNKRFIAYCEAHPAYAQEASAHRGERGRGATPQRSPQEPNALQTWSSYIG